VSVPQEKYPISQLIYSLLISESVYRRVVVIDRPIHGFSKAVPPTCLLLYCCLRW